MDFKTKIRKLALKVNSISASRTGNRTYVRWLYRLWAPVYDLGVELLGPRYRANAQEMVDRAVRPGDEVLDVGAGTGLLLELIGAKAARYEGIDYSGDMLARAAQRIARLRLPRAALRWGDARSLPFDDGSFDAAVSSFMLPHLAPDEKVAVLSEMARVLRPGGRVGLFLAQGEVASLYATAEQLSGYLRRAGFEQIRLFDRDGVYRIATAEKPQ